ncbi:putative F-box/kelch-repeat protein-like isoform X2 [Capsicum annuum]|nr:putative F-box/kelch-repeat protein-like isoform X2 [Capsicum annuum]
MGPTRNLPPSRDMGIEMDDIKRNLKMERKPRFVCKSWLSLISSPQFVKAHLLLSSTNKDYTHHRVLCEAYYSNPDVRGCSVSSLLCDSVTEALDLDYHRKIFGAHPRLGHPSDVEVKMYSLKSDSWSRIGDLQYRELFSYSAKFVKGKLHWLDKQWNIISIDLTNEKWIEV